MNSNNNTPKKVNAALTFSIPMGNSCARQPPKKLLVLVKARQHKVEAPTLKSLNDKQMLAEKRRKKRREWRVRRTRENREALTKMAKDIEKFKNIQLSTDTSPASMKQSKETVVLAEKIASGFDRLSNRYHEDLQTTDNFFIHQPNIPYMGP
ncbi:hypothetical protein QZH41_018705 [Actinostola sp. cb2023]|nr:hypothetical protein QZH41_018705 [Actinostola sp. cb2023]